MQYDGHPNALLTRSSSGVTVEACFLPLTDIYGVTVTISGVSMWASCERETFLDAYHHPALYLSAAQCDKLGLR